MGISRLDALGVLGLQEKADHAKIKATYKKLALQYHPDKSDAPDAKEIFQDLSDAYSRLTDPEREHEGGESDYEGEEEGEYAAHDDDFFMDVFFKVFHGTYFHKGGGGGGGGGMRSGVSGYTVHTRCSCGNPHCGEEEDEDGSDEGYDDEDYDEPGYAPPYGYRESRRAQRRAEQKARARAEKEARDEEFWRVQAEKARQRQAAQELRSKEKEAKQKEREQQKAAVKAQEEAKAQAEAQLREQERQEVERVRRAKLAREVREQDALRRRLFDMVAGGDVAGAKELLRLEQGKPSSVVKVKLSDRQHDRGKEGATLLHVCVVEAGTGMPAALVAGRLEVAEWLLSVPKSAGGPDASHFNERGLTPLHACCEAGDIGLLRALLAQRPGGPHASEIDIDGFCLDKGWTPLMYAAVEARIEAVELLLAVGARVTQQNEPTVVGHSSPKTALDLVGDELTQQKLDPSMAAEYRTVKSRLAAALKSVERARKERDAAKRMEQVAKDAEREKQAEKADHERTLADKKKRQLEEKHAKRRQQEEESAVAAKAAAAAVAASGLGKKKGGSGGRGGGSKKGGKNKPPPSPALPGGGAWGTLRQHPASPAPAASFAGVSASPPPPRSAASMQTSSSSLRAPEGHGRKENSESNGGASAAAGGGTRSSPAAQAAATREQERNREVQQRLAAKVSGAKVLSAEHYAQLLRGNGASGGVIAGDNSSSVEEEDVYANANSIDYAATAAAAAATDISVGYKNSASTFAVPEAAGLQAPYPAFQQQSHYAEQTQTMFSNGYGWQGPAAAAAANSTSAEFPSHQQQEQQQQLHQRQNSLSGMVPAVASIPFQPYGGGSFSSLFSPLFGQPTPAPEAASIGWSSSAPSSTDRLVWEAVHSNSGRSHSGTGGFGAVGAPPGSRVLSVDELESSMPSVSGPSASFHWQPGPVATESWVQQLSNDYSAVRPQPLQSDSGAAAAQQRQGGFATVTPERHTEGGTKKAAAPEAREDSGADALYATLVDMGFDMTSCCRATQECGFELDAVIGWLISNT